jgi:hypothetical protein
VAQLEIDDVVVVVRRRWLVAALAAWPLACIPIAIVLASHGMPLAILPLMVVTIGIALAIRRWPHRWRGKASASGDALMLDGRVIAKREDITSGISSIRDGRMLVRLSRGWAGIDVDIELEREGEAKALLQALRLDRAHRTTQLVASPGSPREAGRMVLIATLALAALGIAPVFLGVAGLAFTALAMLGAAALVLRSIVTLTVGADGVLIRRGLARDRFVPYKEIEAVRSSEHVLDIVMKGGGPPVRVHLGGLGHRMDRALHGDDLDFRLRAFTERISEAMRDGSDATAFVPERLARGGRTVAKWLHDLRGSAEDKAGFRENAVPSDVLIGIVESPTALPTARAGAAVALGVRREDPELRVRLRVAAEACASPALRVALTSAAEAEDADASEDRLADALERLDDDPHAGARFSRKQADR